MKKNRRTGDKVKFACNFLFQLLRFQKNFPRFFLICKCPETTILTLNIILRSTYKIT